MKRLGLLALVLIAGGAMAVEPAYLGPYGNAEEPALRPYKWAYQGVKGFFWHSGQGLREGNLKFPVIGTVELGRGVRRGSFELGESIYRGLSFARTPEKVHEYRNLHVANEAIEERKGAEIVTDFIPTTAMFTLFGYPVQRLVDRYPARDELEVAAVKQKREDNRDIRRVERKLKEMEKEEEGERITWIKRRDKTEQSEMVEVKEEKIPKAHKGNLLKLAKKKK